MMFKCCSTHLTPFDEFELQNYQWWEGYYYFHFFIISVPEIEQGLSDASRSIVRVSFTPHLMPMVNIQLRSCSYLYCGSLPLCPFDGFVIIESVLNRAAACNQPFMWKCRMG